MISFIRKNLIIFFLISMIIFLLNLEFKNVITSCPQITSNLVETRLNAIQELATLKYYYKNVVSYKDTKEFQSLHLPFSSKSLLVVYSGYVKAGVDMSMIHIELRPKNDIVIQIKEAQILDHVINEEEVVIYDEHSDLFNNLEIQDYLDVIVEEKEKIAKDLINKGFLEEANEKTYFLLYNLLNDMGFNHIEIHFVS